MELVNTGSDRLSEITAGRDCAKLINASPFGLTTQVLGEINFGESQLVIAAGDVRSAKVQPYDPALRALLPPDSELSKKPQRYNPANMNKRPTINYDLSWFRWDGGVESGEGVEKIERRSPNQTGGAPMTSSEWNQMLALQGFKPYFWYPDHKDAPHEAAPPPDPLPGIEVSLIRELFPQFSQSEGRIYALFGCIRPPGPDENYSLWLGEVLSYQYPLEELVTASQGGKWVWFGIAEGPSLWGESLPPDYDPKKLVTREAELGEALRAIDLATVARSKVTDAPEAFGKPYSR
jgi:hypothetical protein